MMTELHLPWIETAILIPLIGAGWVAFLRDPRVIRQHSIILSFLAFVSALGGFIDFSQLNTFDAHDHWDVLGWLTGSDPLLLDELSAPLLPITALIFAVIILATLRTALRRFSFGSALLLQAIGLATVASRDPWLVVGLLTLATLVPLVDQLRKGRPVRIYAIHMGVFVGLMVSGQALAEFPGMAMSGAALTALGLLVRCGVVPFHGWVSDQFEHGSFGLAILNSAPMLGVYGMMRLVVPSAPPWVLSATIVLAVITAAYAASMAFIQTSARRFYSFIFIGHSALVLIGVDMATPVGLTGALSIWLSLALAITGLGLALRCVEARVGRVSLTEYRGLHARIPTLAAFFLITGLACIGFPGTIGFVGAEILFEGALDMSPWIGATLVLAAALNSLALLKAYFYIFTGATHVDTIDLRIRGAERIALLALTLMILGGGVYPQPGVSSRYHAARELISLRQRSLKASPADFDQQETSSLPQNHEHSAGTTLPPDRNGH